MTQPQAIPTRPSPSEFHLERHYSVAEVAVLWQLSADTIRRLFADEPGVLAMANPRGKHRRRYATLRIPETVLARVHRRMTSGA